MHFKSETHFWDLSSQQTSKDFNLLSSAVLNQNSYILLALSSLLPSFNFRKLIFPIYWELWQKVHNGWQTPKRFSSYKDEMDPEGFTNTI